MAGRDSLELHLGVGVLDACSRVKRDELPDDTPSSAQGWFINTRREKFKSPKLREALIDAFDFEWTNKNVMYSSYQRTHSSIFPSSTLASAIARPAS